MSLEPELRSLLWDRCTVQPFVSENAYGGGGSYGTATTHPCRVTYKSRLLKDGQGRDVLAVGKIYFGPSTTGGYPQLTVRSKVVLSDGRSPRLLAVQAYDDDEGPHHESADFG